MRSVCTHTRLRAGVFPVQARIACVSMCWNTRGGGGNYRVLPCKLWSFHLSKLDLMREADSNACSGGSMSF